MSPNWMPEDNINVKHTQAHIEFVKKVVEIIIGNRDALVEFSVSSSFETVSVLISSANGRAIAELESQGFEVRVYQHGVRVQPKMKRT